jgi:DNA polymerase I-like protein with 3'-5' exonuclease and polymerase domains
MARIISTQSMDPTSLSDFEREMAYNGLDCCITREVYEAIKFGHNELTTNEAQTYALSKALQGPVLEMNARGVLVDQGRRTEVLEEYYDALAQLERQLELIVLDGVGMKWFNWRSNDDLKLLFYTHLQIPEIKRYGRPTVDRAALEKMEAYTITKQIIAHMSTMRELAKDIGVLKTDIDTDGRMRTSYNIAGTNTGRFSSSYSEYGTGGNVQNIKESLRSIFIADPGYKFAKFDAKSGESYVVGGIEWNLFNDPIYLDAVDSGDVHTAVARICWPGLKWTNDLSKDKDIAETKFYRHLSHRDMCKKLGHGSNYGGKAETLSQQTKLPINIVRQFQPKYFDAFPSHERWQEWVKGQVWTKGYLINLMGRKRWFLGRRNDPDVIREAIAFDPQGSLADIVNIGMLNTWRKRPAILMMQDHDATTWMYHEELEDQIVPQLRQMLAVDVPLKNGRTLSIPYDCQVGWNRGKYDARKNPNGLINFKGHDDRQRQAEVGLLDRVIYRANRKSR